MNSGEFSLSDGVKIMALRPDLTNPCQCLQRVILFAFSRNVSLAGNSKMSLDDSFCVTGSDGVISIFFVIF